MGCPGKEAVFAPSSLTGQFRLIVELAETVRLRQRDADFLAGIDQIRILDHLPVGFENFRIVSRIAQELLGDS